MKRSKRVRRHITSEASNKVPGYPLEIFDFVSGSGSYISDRNCHRFVKATASSEV